jgi:tRNA-splicing ligase RtcB
MHECGFRILKSANWHLISKLKTMGNLKLKGKDILKLGYPNNQSVNIALEVMKRNFATKNIHHVKSLLKEILQNPEQFEKDLTFGQIAEALLSSKKTEKRMLNTNVLLFRFSETIFLMKQKSAVYRFETSNFYTGCFNA